MALNLTSPDSQRDAAAALMAYAIGDEVNELEALVSRLPRLVKSLKPYGFSLTAQCLAGLLIQPENHTATARIEALIHLAALACHGHKQPSRRCLHKWLNGLAFNDPVTELETPVEDVFVSNVVTPFGNARLFEGRWQKNADYVQICIQALLRITNRSWATDTLRHILAMLRVSEAVAARARVQRYSRTESRPRQTITITPSAVTESKRLVNFTNDELLTINVDPTLLSPFVFQTDHSDALMSQSIEQSALQRRPLARFGEMTTVVLPTAIGAAIRRFIIERAAVARELVAFQSACHGDQYWEVFMIGRAAWSIKFVKALKHDSDNDMREFVGTFDDGGYVHVIFVPDDFEEISQTGLSSVHQLDGTIKNRISDRAAWLANKPDYRCGLTVLIHGGIGRAFSPVWADLPSGWHQLCLSAPEFMLLGSESEFTAMRVWKLLQQVDDLEEKGVVFPNVRGFLNLVAFAYWTDFELVPINMNLGPLYLHSDVILPLTHRLRATLDRHAALAPDGSSWVSVQRDNTPDFLSVARGRLVYLSPAAMAQCQLLACVESHAHPWWIACTELPDPGWHRTIAFHILELSLGWLVHLPSLLEKQLPALMSRPVAYRFRFPDIETLSQYDTQPVDPPMPPAISLDQGHVVIECTPRYLQTFLRPGNLGDRLMIACLVRGAYLTSRSRVPTVNVVEELVRAVVGSDDARFLQMIPSETPQDAIFDRATLSPLRLLMPEDLAWSRFNLARRAGYQSAPGSIPLSQADVIFKNAVDRIWERVRSRLTSLCRESVIRCSLLNFVAAQKEHRDWHRSSAAQLALYDNSKVLAAANQRAFRRDTAGLACRVIAEMALCTSPYEDGLPCTETDLDLLIAEVVVLLECANHSDALRYQISAGQPMMYPNGSFGFNVSTNETIVALFTEHRKREFLNAAENQTIRLKDEHQNDVAAANYAIAFIAEFGSTEEQYQRFALQLTSEALEINCAHLLLRKSEVIRRLGDANALYPKRAFDSRALTPRPRWDENNPTNAKRRDWYPWRYNRRLSILRRPLVQLSNDYDPMVLIMPSILADSMDYLGQAALGRLPEGLFDSTQMIAYIGYAADKNGHEFNRKVAQRLNTLPLESKAGIEPSPVRRRSRAWRH